MTTRDDPPDATGGGHARGSLLESGRRAERPVFTAALSTMAHIALVAAAVAATGETPALARLGTHHAAEHVTRVVLPRRAREPRVAAVAAAPPAASALSAAMLPVAPAMRVALNFSAPELPPVSQPAPLLLAPVSTESTGDAANDGESDGAFDEDAVDLRAQLVGGQFTPPYPDSLRYDHPDGRVLVRFVIDSSGRVDVGSIRIVMATDRAFGESVRSTIPGLRFVPAVRDGRRVRVRVEHLFEFHCAC